MKNTLEILKKDFGFYKDFSAIFRNKKERGKFISQGIGFAIIAAYTFFAMMYLLSNAEVFFANNLQEEFLMIGFSFLILILLMFVAPGIYSKIYYSNEMKILMRLPISNQDLMITRILSLSIGSLIYAFFITIPSIIKYGLYFGKGIIFYINAILNIISLNITIISICALIIVFVMKFINKSRKLKKVLQYIFTLLFFALIIAFQFGIQSFSSSVGAEMLTKNIGNAIHNLYNIFPILRVVSMSLMEENLLMSIFYTLLLVAIAIFVLFVVVKFGSKMMIEGIVNADTVQSKKKKISKNTKNSQNSVLYEIYTKEVKAVFSNAMFFINKVVVGLVIPFAIILPVAFSGQINLSEFGNEISRLRLLLGTVFTNSTLVIMAGSVMITLLITLFISMNAELASISFSLEGKNIWLVQTLPIKAQDQILSRILASMTIMFVASLPMLILLSIFVSLLEFNILYIVLILLTNIITSFTLSAFAMILGQFNVKTNWDNPQEVIKGFHSFLLLLTTIALSIGMIFSTLKLFDIFGENIVIMPFIWLGIFLILGIALYFVNIHIYPKRVTKFSIK